MAKIGRNYPCLCGSGKKFKKCCLGLGAGAQTKPAIPSVTIGVEKIQQNAAAQKELVLALGVFVLFSTTGGDAWLLEVTDMDAIQVARGREKLAVEIVENPDTIEINWSHKFKVKNKKFVLTSYLDKSEETREDYPTHAILAMVKRICSHISPELAGALHLDTGEEKQAGEI